MPAPWTDSKVIDQTVALMKDIGQSPVVIKKEVNGFILNRLQYAVIMEAWRLVEVGLCEVAGGGQEAFFNPKPLIQLTSRHETET